MGTTSIMSLVVTGHLSFAYCSPWNVCSLGQSRVRTCFPQCTYMYQADRAHHAVCSCVVRFLGGTVTDIILKVDCNQTLTPVHGRSLTCIFRVCTSKHADRHNSCGVISTYIHVGKRIRFGTGASKPRGEKATVHRLFSPAPTNPLSIQSFRTRGHT